MSEPMPDLAVLARMIVSATDAEEFLAALRALHRLRAAIDGLEPELITAARDAGVSWQALAPALGVASRQAAERRYLRLVPAVEGQAGSTRDQRVQQVRDRRAGVRAVNDWANHNTAGLRRLAGQIAALAGPGPAPADLVRRLDYALGDVDATALPSLLIELRPHLSDHPALVRQIDAVTASTDRVRRDTYSRRGHGGDHAP